MGRFSPSRFSMEKLWPEARSIGQAEYPSKTWRRGTGRFGALWEQGSMTLWKDLRYSIANSWPSENFKLMTVNRRRFRAWRCGMAPHGFRFTKISMPREPTLRQCTMANFTWAAGSMAELPVSPALTWKLSEA